MRFDFAEPAYDGRGRADPLRPYVAFLYFLWTEVRPTIMWNAPRVPFPFEPLRRPLARRAFSNVHYAAVRDEVSSGHLLEAGIDGPAEIVPDTGVPLAKTISDCVDAEWLRALLGARGPAGGDCASSVVPAS
ncbi:MAG: hypothetical protein K0S10_57 [Rubrobacteraceae bacterium]|nr:hypothetical protein [Rubrobacteraceae bacterium]